MDISVHSGSFRVEDGKIAEHWDVMETILTEADRKNTNGKFNF